MKKKFIFLGTGGSVGVPLIGCSCDVCHSPLSFNKRLRPSALLQTPQGQFLIDAGPDFRTQALRQGIVTLKGVILTHAHYDHTAGFDDLRPFYFRQKAPLPILLSAETADDLRMRYYYLFEPKPGQESIVTPRFHFQLLPNRAGKINFEGLDLQYLTYTQGGMSVNGYRIGDLAYLSDIRHFSSTIFEELNGIKLLIVSALRYTPSPLHFSVDEAVDFAKQLKAERVWLTHLSHDLEYTKTNAYLPSNMCLAYDGLEIEFD